MQQQHSVSPSFGDFEELKPAGLAVKMAVQLTNSQDENN
jgi:hypothetical protein